MYEYLIAPVIKRLAVPQPSCRSAVAVLLLGTRSRCEVTTDVRVRVHIINVVQGKPRIQLVETI